MRILPTEDLELESPLPREEVLRRLAALVS
jgi:hypothetical protein